MTSCRGATAKPSTNGPDPGRRSPANPARQAARRRIGDSRTGVRAPACQEESPCCSFIQPLPCVVCTGLLELLLHAELRAVAALLLPAVGGTHGKAGVAAADHTRSTQETTASEQATRTRGLLRTVSFAHAHEVSFAHCPFHRSPGRHDRCTIVPLSVCLRHQSPLISALIMHPLALLARLQCCPVRNCRNCPTRTQCSTT